MNRLSDHIPKQLHGLNPFPKPLVEPHPGDPIRNRPKNGDGNPSPFWPPISSGVTNIGEEVPKRATVANTHSLCTCRYLNVLYSRLRGYVSSVCRRPSRTTSGGMTKTATLTVHHGNHTTTTTTTAIIITLPKPPIKFNVHQIYRSRPKDKRLPPPYPPVLSDIHPNCRRGSRYTTSESDHEICPVSHQVSAGSTQIRIKI